MFERPSVDPQGYRLSMKRKTASKTVLTGQFLLVSAEFPLPGNSAKEKTMHLIHLSNRSLSVIILLQEE